MLAGCRCSVGRECHPPVPGCCCWALALVPAEYRNPGAPKAMPTEVFNPTSNPVPGKSFLWDLLRAGSQHLLYAGPPGPVALGLGLGSVAQSSISTYPETKGEKKNKNKKPWRVFLARLGTGMNTDRAPWLFSHDLLGHMPDSMLSSSGLKGISGVAGA